MLKVLHKTIDTDKKKMFKSVDSVSNTEVRNSLCASAWVCKGIFSQSSLFFHPRVKLHHDLRRVNQCSGVSGKSFFECKADQALRKQGILVTQELACAFKPSMWSDIFTNYIWSKDQGHILHKSVINHFSCDCVKRLIITSYFYNMTAFIFRW